MTEKSACELVVLVGQVGKVESWLYLSRNGMLGECTGRERCDVVCYAVPSASSMTSFACRFLQVVSPCSKVRSSVPCCTRQKVTPSDSTSLFRRSSSKNSLNGPLTEFDVKPQRWRTISEYGMPVFLCSSWKCFILDPRSLPDCQQPQGKTVGYAVIYPDRSLAGRKSLPQA